MHVGERTTPESVTQSLPLFLSFSTWYATKPASITGNAKYFCCLIEWAVGRKNKLAGNGKNPMIKTSEFDH